MLVARRAGASHDWMVYQPVWLVPELWESPDGKRHGMWTGPGVAWADMRGKDGEDQWADPPTAGPWRLWRASTFSALVTLLLPYCRRTLDEYWNGARDAIRASSQSAAAPLRVSL